ncbi:hypothetical protein BOX15_Mlig021272g1, partial [Macrostomum lignano]
PEMLQRFRQLDHLGKSFVGTVVVFVSFGTGFVFFVKLMRYRQLAAYKAERLSAAEAARQNSS